MAVITSNLLTTDHAADAGGNSIGDVTTASVSPTAKKLVLVAVSSNRQSASGTPNTPTVSGAGMTWDQIATITEPTTSIKRLTLFRGLSTSPGSGALTISHGGQLLQNVYWAVVQFGNVAQGANGANAVVQSATNATSGTSLTVSLGAFKNRLNATVGAFYENGGNAITPGAGFTQLSLASASHSLQTQFAGDNRTSVSWSEGATLSLLGIGLEIKASPLFFGGML